ncbi:MAG: hypothetical protein H5U17_00535 [Defluviimonas sp.]|nr:hypothetical protein [Defluviimonas sp.]
MSAITAKELARQLRERQRDAVEVVEQVFDDVAAHDDPALFIRLTRDRALAEARAARERLRAGNPASLLDGVPLGLSIPNGSDADGLPTALMICGIRGRDRALLAAGLATENLIRE